VSETLGDTPAAGAAVGVPAPQDQERATDNLTRVRVSSGPLVGPVLRRVVSIVLARADWPLEDLDDALLVCDALGAHAPARARDGRMVFSVQASERKARLCVHELSEDGAAQLVGDATLPGVGNVLERIADSVSVETDEGDGEGSQLVLVLSTGSH
jgi:hypothetical protein